MERVERTNKRSGTVVDARMSLAMWLRAGRADRGLSLEDVAKVTKIQARILERLETGKFDGLPADVFVRGFVRSVARCVGLDENEALRRYGACGKAEHGAPHHGVTSTARALVDTMSDLAPVTARTSPGVPTILTDTPMAEGSARIATAVDAPVVEAATEAAVAPSEPAVETVRLPETGTLIAEPIVDASAVEVVPAQPLKKKRTRRATAAAGAAPAKPRSRRKALAVGTDASPIVVAPAEPIAAVAKSPDSPQHSPDRSADDASVELVIDIPVEVSETPIQVVELAETFVIDAAPAVEDLWAPRMPAMATTSTVPWRRPSNASQAKALVPTIVIDDADPESAERELEERKEPVAIGRRSFLPPILLDREDRSARQGGLTLAVIILLIAATLTLSYLMRRPGSSGDGVTRLETPASMSLTV